MRAAFVLLGVLMIGCASISGLDELVVSGDGGASSSSGGTSSSSGGSDGGGVEVGTFPCGNATCAVGQTCCISNSSDRSSCTSCGPHETQISCGSSSQCAPGETCCGTTSGNGTLHVSCTATCTTSQEFCMPSGGAPVQDGCRSPSALCNPGAPVVGYGLCSP